MLEITLSRLRSFGVREVIVNAYHLADMIVDYLNVNNNFGMKIEVSHEAKLLDTGGGLKKAAHFFFEGSPQTDAPFIVHNVDVLSTIDLGRMLQFHTQNQALATLAVQDRKTSRHLLFDDLFDDRLELCGRQSHDKDPEIVRDCQQPQALAFSGIHIISPRLLGMLSEDGAFSIITSYLRLAAQGEKILAFRADEYYWRDLGKPEQVEQAVRDIQQGVITP